MKETFIDVESARTFQELTRDLAVQGQMLTVENGTLIVQGDVSTSQAVAKRIINEHRETVNRIARDAGGELRTDRMPEIYMRIGADIVDGGEELLLTSSRWAAWVPDNFDPQRASADSR